MGGPGVWSGGSHPSSEAAGSSMPGPTLSGTCFKSCFLFLSQQVRAAARGLDSLLPTGTPGSRALV